MALFCTTHHTLTIESWNENGVHVLDQDTQNVRLLLRDEDEVERFIASIRATQQGVKPTIPNVRDLLKDGKSPHGLKKTR